MVGSLVLVSVLGFIALAAVLYIIGVYNSVVRLTRYIDKNFANLESFLKQRHDEIPKLVNACQAYMQHERGTLQEVVALRAAFDRAGSSEEKIRIENRLNGALGKLNVAVEAYPDLKASDQFGMLMGRFSTLETSINDQRQIFNDSVTQHNICIKEFPALLIAGAIGAAERSLLEIPKEQQSDNLAPFPLK
ncbi:MAG TPA: LemA family protein [Desulfuromonadales bacterium]|jgi:LemA protein